MTLIAVFAAGTIMAATPEKGVAPYPGYRLV